MDQNSASTHPNGVSRSKSSTPDSEVTPKAKNTRRTFTAQQKLKILEETDGLSQGEVGTYLRRKGIYWSNLSKWRKLRESGLLNALEPKQRGAPARPPEIRRIAELERENGHLRGKLDQAEKIIDVQKKLCELFGQPPTCRHERN